MKNLLLSIFVVFSAEASSKIVIPESAACPVAEKGTYTINPFLVVVSYPNFNIFKLPRQEGDRPTTFYDNVARAFIAGSIVALFLTRNNGTATTLTIFDLLRDRTNSIQGVLMDTVRLKDDGTAVQYAIRTEPKKVITQRLLPEVQ